MRARGALTVHHADGLGSVRADTWSPPPVYVYKPLHRPGDFYQFSTPALITSPRATEVLRPFLEMAGELLPLPHDGRVFTLLNVTECIDCLDAGRTEWVLDPQTGARVMPGRYAFHPDRFSGSQIFKIPETYRGEVLLVAGRDDPAEEFRHHVEHAGLEGLVLELLWSDEGG